MKICYLDLSCGLSGDMLAAALLDLGVPLGRLKSYLEKVPLEGYAVSMSRVKRSGFDANRFEVRIAEGITSSHRSLKDIEEIISSSALCERVQDKCVRVFRRLAAAEAKAHGKSVEDLKFHEVGATDSIIDVVSAVVLLELLGVEKLYASSFSTGSGFVEAAHGRIPLPAPATAELLKGFPVRFAVREGEVTTPTGAAIVTTLADSIGAMPAMKVLGVGRGAGANDPAGFPNILRAFLAEASEEPRSEDVWLIEVNLDDFPPEQFEVTFERLFSAGALDVFVVPILMKKGRPAHLLSVICAPEVREAVEEIIFSETTTFGLRRVKMERSTLEREFSTVETPLGTIKVKLGKRGGRLISVSPEFEECKRIAKERGVPLRKVFQLAHSAALSLFEGRFR